MICQIKMVLTFLKSSEKNTLNYHLFYLLVEGAKALQAKQSQKE